MFMKFEVLKITACKDEDQQASESNPSVWDQSSTELVGYYDEQEEGQLTPESALRYMRAGWMAHDKDEDFKIVLECPSLGVVICEGEDYEIEDDEFTLTLVNKSDCCPLMAIRCEQRPL